MANSQSTSSALLPNPNPASIAGTMTQPTVAVNAASPKPYTSAVITPAPAIEQTNNNTAQLAEIQNKAKEIQNNLAILKLKGYTDTKQVPTGIDIKDLSDYKAPVEKTESATDKAIKKAAGVTDVPDTNPYIQRLRDVADNQNAQWAAMSSTVDGYTNQLISSIRAEYDGLIKEQEATNKAYEGGVTVEGMVSGRARYAPNIAMGDIQAAVSAGIGKISAIQVKKQGLIAQAESARTEKQFAILDKKMVAYRDLIKEERAAAQETFENTIKLSQEARAKAKEEHEELANNAASLATRLNSITSPTEREQYLTEYAKRLGVDPTALESSVANYNDMKNKEVTTTILGLSKDYLDAGITSDDIRGADLMSVMAKITGSDSYKRKVASEVADTNYKIAQATKSAAVGGDTDVATLQFFADRLTSRGVLDPYVPKGAQGVIYEMAKESAKSLPKGSLIDATTTVGVEAGRIGEQQRNALAAGAGLMTQAEELRRFMDRISSFPGAGTVIKAGKIVKLSSTDRESFNSIATNMKSLFVQSRSGMAASEPERAELGKLLPSEGQWKDYNTARLDQFAKGFRSSMRGTLDTSRATLKDIDLRSDSELRREYAGYLQSGEILVRNWDDGGIYAITQVEYNPVIYEKINQ
jgi:hypothetical protein